MAWGFGNRQAPRKGLVIMEKEELTQILRRITDNIEILDSKISYLMNRSYYFGEHTKFEDWEAVNILTESLREDVRRLAVCGATPEQAEAKGCRIDEKQQVRV
jgi:hypothetical protein